jgi:hypothetical protein
MNHDLICAWLGLPQEVWPPDHYRLLGLEPGEDDVTVIEQRVHQRLDCVRRYQLLHPEQATEAMNRLAQAFVCLTEPSAKRAYDAELLGDRAPQPAVSAVVPEAAVATQDPLEWLYAPTVPGETPQIPLPPVRNPPALRVPPPLPPRRRADATELLDETDESEPVTEAEPEAPPEPPPPPPPPPEPVDPVIEAAQRAPQSRKGLSTKRALYRRVARTRRLLRLWHRIGKYLEDPDRQLSRAEAGELYKLLGQVAEELEDFPPPLGEAGQPGYLIVALTQMEDARTRIQTLSASQRQPLARDWQAGLKFLSSHREFLREEVRAMRRRGLGTRIVRATRAMFNEQPGYALLLLLIGLVAMTWALYRQFKDYF